MVSAPVLQKSTRPAGGNSVELRPNCCANASSPRSAWICRQAVALRQKQFAIGKVDGEDRLNGGGMTIVTRVFAAGGKG